MNEKKKLLIVDDELALARSLQRVVEREGMDCITAGSVDDAWAILKKQPVDLCLVDLAMPGKTGIDLMKMVRADEALKDLPMIVISGFASHAEKEVSQLSPVGILQKPIPLEELLWVIKDGLRRPQS